MKIFADKDFFPVLKRFALMGTVALFAACGDDTSSVKPVDDDPGSEISSSSEQSSSSSKGDTLSSGAESSSSSETDVSSSSVTLKEFPLESYTKDSFKNPDIEYQTMTDERDGHVYRIVTIGMGDSAMTWMAENLNFSENTTDSALSINLKSQTSCPFGKAESCGILGRLYTWTAAMNISEGYKDSIPSAKKIVLACADNGRVPVAVSQGRRKAWPKQAGTCTEVEGGLG